jgi:hypothetical protein
VPLSETMPRGWLRTSTILSGLRVTWTPEIDYRLPQASIRGGSRRPRQNAQAPAMGHLIIDHRATSAGSARVAAASASETQWRISPAAAAHHLPVPRCYSR